MSQRVVFAKVKFFLPILVLMILILLGWLMLDALTIASDSEQITQKKLDQRHQSAAASVSSSQPSDSEKESIGLVEVNPALSPCSSLDIPAENSLRFWLKLEFSAKQKLFDESSPLTNAMSSAINSGDVVEEISGLHMRLQLSKLKFQHEDSLPDSCGDSLMCGEQRMNNWLQEESRLTNEIAKLATYSSSKQAYALAFHICRMSQSKDSAYCGQIDANQWISRDPENAIPWLYLLDNFSKDSSPASQVAIDNILYRVSTTKLMNVGLAPIVNFQNSGKMMQGDPYARFRLLDATSQIQKHYPRPNLSPLLNACHGAAIRQAHRFQTCEIIANRFLSDESNLAFMITAKKLGENLGWTRQRLSSIQQEIDAMSSLVYVEPNKNFLIKSGSMQGYLKHYCETYWNSMRLAERMMQDGEVASLRRALVLHKKSSIQ
jgi:hypothetical protein